jgi:hypothetical protein
LVRLGAYSNCSYPIVPQRFFYNGKVLSKEYASFFSFYELIGLASYDQGEITMLLTTTPQISVASPASDVDVTDVTVNVVVVDVAVEKDFADEAASTGHHSSERVFRSQKSDGGINSR